MKILITGGAGFIGSALIRYIINNTDHHVVNIDKLTYASNLDSLNSIESNKNYFFERIDICDESAVRNVFSNYQPDIIMHLAAESHVDRSIEGPADFINTNIMGTFNLLDIAKSYYEGLDNSKKKNFRFHHVSTDEVYGDLKDLNSYFLENTPYNPSSPYSASKAASDHLVRAWGRTYNLPIVVTNCSNNYGPYHFPEKLIPHMILNAIHGKSLPIYGDGSQVRDWLYVDDHVRALYEVAIRGKLGDTYNIGGNNEMTNLDVVKTICHFLDELVPKKPNSLESFSELITFVKDRPGHDLRYAIDASKIRDELGWQPRESFETGLRKTVLWFLNNQAWWQKILSGEYRLSRIGDN